MYSASHNNMGIVLSFAADFKGYTLSFLDVYF